MPHTRHRLVPGSDIEVSGVLHELMTGSKADLSEHSCRVHRTSRQADASPAGLRAGSNTGECPERDDLTQHLVWSVCPNSACHLPYQCTDKSGFLYLCMDKRRAITALISSLLVPHDETRVCTTGQRSRTWTDSVGCAPHASVHHLQDQATCMERCLSGGQTPHRYVLSPSHVYPVWVRSLTRPPRSVQPSARSCLIRLAGKQRGNRDPRGGQPD